MPVYIPLPVLLGKPVLFHIVVGIGGIGMPGEIGTILKLFKLLLSSIIKPEGRAPLSRPPTRVQLTRSLLPSVLELVKE